jgi:hypothetical protein
MMVHSIAILRTDPCSRARQAWCLVPPTRSVNFIDMVPPPRCDAGPGMLWPVPRYGGMCRRDIPWR